MNIFFDTSVLVAASLQHHTLHAQASSAVRQVIRKRNNGCISAHGLAETYSVLTRIPVTPRIHPSEALQIIQRNILPHFEVIALDANDYKAVIEEAASYGWSGGVVYDMLHISCAVKRSVDRIYTLNLSEFRRIAPKTLQDKIRNP